MWWRIKKNVAILKCVTSSTAKVWQSFLTTFNEVSDVIGRKLHIQPTVLQFISYISAAL